MSADIILSTLNARYIHASLGLRYLLANMGALRSRTRLREFTINAQITDIAETLLQDKPKIIGLGVYIWNANQSLQLVRQLKLLSPETLIILGGPEVSYETETQEIIALADYVIPGQADLAFAQLCQQLLDGRPPLQKVVSITPFKLAQLQLPYREYSDEDIRNRVIYVEASRGCPFRCEFCLSSLDKTVYPFDLDIFLEEMQQLYERGVRSFKFIDRTFNLKVASSIRIMEFFLQKMQQDKLYLHFELIPDHLPEKLKSTIARFPPHSLQFEIGIQSLDTGVQARISRKQDNEKMQANLRWLRQHSQAHIHADLIVGLPGEDMAMFGRGFDQLVALQPHEIQVGILKRLRGTPIIRHTEQYDMRYNPQAPYEILANRDIDFASMQRLKRFARYWDMIANSGRFKQIMPLLLADSPFANFMTLSDWLYANTDQTHKIALPRLFELLFHYLQQQRQLDPAWLNKLLLKDYQAAGLKGSPDFAATRHKYRSGQRRAESRQQRHLS